MTGKKLTLRQQLFCQEYMRDLNATKAAIRAGYSEKSAMEQGYQLLQKPPVQKAISEAIKERTERTKIDGDWILQNSAELFQQCIGQKPLMHGDEVAKDEHGQPIYKFSPANAARLLEIIGRHTDIQCFAPTKYKLEGSISLEERKALLEEVERRHAEAERKKAIEGEYEEVD